MPAVSTLLRYLKYRTSASTGHGIHSPFIYELVTEVIRKKGGELPEVERMRHKLTRNDAVIEVTDFGAGTKRKVLRRRRISDIATRSALPPRYAALLNRLSCHYKPARMLELGTSLGFTTLYLASGNPSAQVVTLEGCPATAALAGRHFLNAGAVHVELITGPFKDTLAGSLEKLGGADLVFFDGNHNRDATLGYYRLCKKYRSGKSVFIFDDINWSPGMQKAWLDIQGDPDVTATVDLFRMGLAFFSSDLQKENFLVRF